MEITIRNITKDTMVDFNNDHTITLPMDGEKLRNILGDDEWIVVDGVPDELTNITALNDRIREIGEDDFCILAKAFIPKEAMEISEYTIIDFDAETSQYNSGFGVIDDENWRGFVLHELGYEDFPFKYTDEMEDYVKWEQLWFTAESEGWVNIRYNETAYLVKKW